MEGQLFLLLTGQTYTTKIQIIVLHLTFHAIGFHSVTGTDTNDSLLGSYTVSGNDSVPTFRSKVAPEQN